MKTALSKVKSGKSNQPFEVVKVGSISIPIYAHNNIIPQRDPQSGAILYETQPDGTRKALVKYQSAIYTVAYYQGTKRVRQKFSDLTKARREADLIAIKLANGESEALKLTGGDRADYVRAMQKLREWKPGIDLNLAVTDYVAAMRRLPEHVSLSEAVEFFLKRHPVGLPPKTVRDVVDELIASKTNSGKSDVYIKDLTLRLGAFADSFQLRISTVTGKQIEDYIRGLKTQGSKENQRRALSGRTQNNIRRLISTLFKFAIKRGYLPKDNDEIGAVEKATVDSGEIEVFSPAELRKLFDACLTPVKERGKWRTREEMIPYLAVAAFCGLRAAEIQRLDWSEIHLVGPERFVEIKAGNAKTASRRTVPITDNCAAWLERYAKPSGPVINLSRADKQLFLYLAEKSGVSWKHNGLRHSFISYRLAVVKDVGQVSLEAGNSPQMVFKHYRQLVRESEAKEWFGVCPPTPAENVVPLMAVASN
ncbi:MAG TPA: tyrosine-type recombinase/integrase [Verrucomicrobiae bacterium]|nr:tyrosine-type recombinase/integrase [Verrucomicrobiae bacterium]